MRRGEKEREVDFGWDALMRFGGRGGHQVETQSMCCSWNSIQKNWTERRWRLLIKSGCDGKNKGGVPVAAQQIKWQCQSKRVGASQLGRIWQGAGTEGSLNWNLSWSQFPKKCKICNLSKWREQQQRNGLHAMVNCKQHTASNEW